MVNFHLSSEDIELRDGHILVAKCSNGEEHIDSELDLNYYIGNSDGAFQWGGESKSKYHQSPKFPCTYTFFPQDFADSAEDISFELEGDDNVPVLRASLNPADGDPVEANINLAECIGNDGGVLVYGTFHYPSIKRAQSD
ncbi:hypothetical protein FZEAL_3879 [Fusarium zealandicum]|uniref:Cyanovirin-N domain-containing protein n=1 Tax=Fusarium zealandicum TaxID=1053134 RepID=A0A8H4XLB7_9HYPO|nr:hypothetical protein FZEAL_3879 [Fusarium zealandicum]